MLFDSYKNLLEADSSYMHTDASMEAWTFIKHLTTKLYYKIFIHLKQYNKLGSMSHKDLLSRNINSRSLKSFQKLNITVT
ncbi:MAG: hypothetical protein BGO68_01555 [Candidatus Amoebophilus sp. 36-38]|nr:MAG: hypothetical protein BGO68_01555 [Candidatus Amoebophilus sp. 36-38]